MGFLDQISNNLQWLTRRGDVVLLASSLFACWVGWWQTTASHRWLWYEVRRFNQLASVDTSNKQRMIAGKQYEEDSIMKQMKHCAKAICKELFYHIF